MRRNVIATLICTLAMQARLHADDETLQKVLIQIEDMRRFMEKEAQARADETLALKRSLEEARKEIATLKDEAGDLKVKLAAAKSEAEVTRGQTQILEKVIAGMAKHETVRVVNEVAADRPPLDVRGKVTSIADAGLIVVSIGADDGLKQGHVLEVYRNEGKVAVGTLTVVRAYGKQSVGQFKPGGKDRPGVGDDVGNRIFPK